MTVPPRLADIVQRHYGRRDLMERIDEALKAAGHDPGMLCCEDLAPIDEFHIRGRAATGEIARAAGLGAGQHVLDVGCGIGGPARHLAQEFGCRVTGLDLCADYCRVAAALSTRVGLSGRTYYCQANATDLPFHAASFDALWTAHVAMNISDKRRLYGEFRRVLKPQGTLVCYDVFAGSAGPPLFPVPWARTDASSFLLTPAAFAVHLDAAGFTITASSEVTTAAQAWAYSLARSSAPKAAPGLGLLMGPDLPGMIANLGWNLAEGRVRVLWFVARPKGP